MKWRIATTIILLFSIWLITEKNTLAEPANPIANNQIQQIQTDQVDQFWNDLMNKYQNYFPNQQAPSFKDMLMPNGKRLSLSTVLMGLLRYFFHEVIYNGRLLATIMILTVFSMILESLQSAFEKNTVSKVAYAISYMILIIIAIQSFHAATGYAKDAISGMINFMIAVIPLLLTLLASTGNIATVSVLHPLIVFMIHTVGTAIYTIVFPLIFFSAVLHIVSSLTDKYKVTQLANLLRNVSVGLLGMFLTIFLGVISVQGVTGAVTDGVAIRTAKFVTGNFVPVVGRMFSDATDTVIGASLLVKNAVGLSGVVIILLLCAFPAIKILTLALIYNGSAAIMQPLGESPIITCLDKIGKSMIFVFAALAAVGMMFFFAITIIISAGNVSVMMR